MKKALIQKIEKNNLEKKRKKQSPCATRLEKPGQFAWLSSYLFCCIWGGWHVVRLNICFLKKLKTRRFIYHGCPKIEA